MARIAAELADVLTAAKAIPIAAGIVTDAQSFLAMDENDLTDTPPSPPLVSYSFASVDRVMEVINTEEHQYDQATSELEMVVTLWTLVTADQQGDTKALTDSTRGLSILLKRLIGALNNVDLKNSAGDTLTWRPNIFLGARNKGRFKRDDNWRRMAALFNVAFEWKLS